MKKITQKYLKSILDYDPKTGVFHWKRNQGTAKKGSVAGSSHSEGYVSIRINKKLYFAHRLAWLHVHGYFPENNIDHINRNRRDNKINNLREVSQSCNLRNKVFSDKNTSGVTGVSWLKRRGKWQSYITANKKRHPLGTYGSFDDAVCARLSAEQCLNWHDCDSNSSAFRYVRKMLS